MKRLGFFLGAILWMQCALAQVSSENFWQITPRAGYDFPMYGNDLKYIAYDGGIAGGISVDKYWALYGVGVDFDYIQNETQNLYPETNLIIVIRDVKLPIEGIESTINPITRFFLGAGPNLKYQGPEGKIIAELNTRAGVGTVDGGYTNLTGREKFGGTIINLNEHGGYMDDIVFSYKGQARINYYFAPSFGLHIGGYYLGHLGVPEKLSPTGFVEQYYSIENGNQVQFPEGFNNRKNSIDPNLNSFGAFAGISFSPWQKSKSGVDEDVLSKNTYAIRINVENRSTGERIYDANIELTGANGELWNADSSDRGGKNFEYLNRNNYTATAWVNGEKTTIAEIDQEELILGQVVTKTLYLDDLEKNELVDLTVIVEDGPSGQTIPDADVVLKDANGEIVKTAVTNSSGAVTFASIEPGDYNIEGEVYGLETTQEQTTTAEFTEQKSLTKKIYYEDIRFILKGRTVDTYTRADKAGVTVSLKNDVVKNVAQATSANDGSFTFRLDKQTTYTVQGQKHGEFSETESISTLGLNRSETLFVVIELGVAVPTCNDLISLKNIFFDLDKYDIRPEAASELDRVYQLLIENPNMMIEMRSHTDSRGSNSYNQILSQKRANSTKDYLVNRGISPTRIIATGYGETLLTNQCSDGVQCTDAEHQQNRRTEFKIVCQ